MAQQRRGLVSSSANCHNCGSSSRTRGEASSPFSCGEEDLDHLSASFFRRLKSFIVAFFLSLLSLFLSPVSGEGSSTVSPLTPGDLLIALHNIDSNKCDMKSIIKGQQFAGYFVTHEQRPRYVTSLPLRFIDQPSAFRLQKRPLIRQPLKEPVTENKEFFHNF